MSDSPAFVSRRRALRDIGGVAALFATGSLLSATASGAELLASPADVSVLRANAPSECAEHTGRAAARGASTHPAPRERFG